MTVNPAASVKGPRVSYTKGKTPVLSAADTRQLLDSIDTQKVAGARDKALISVMVYSFARVSAALAMNVDDLYINGRRWWIRLKEKGGKRHEMPLHHNAEAYLLDYLDAGNLHDRKGVPLFQSVDRHGSLTENRLDRHNAWAMIRRRAKQAGMLTPIGCHSFRATGITTYMQNGGTLETAQRMAAHASSRTTSLYDRTSDRNQFGRGGADCNLALSSTTSSRRCRNVRPASTPYSAPIFANASIDRSHLPMANSKSDAL